MYSQLSVFLGLAFMDSALHGWKQMWRANIDLLFLYKRLDYLWILVFVEVLKEVSLRCWGTTVFLGSQSYTWIFDSGGVGVPNPPPTLFSVSCTLNWLNGENMDYKEVPADNLKLLRNFRVKLGKNWNMEKTIQTREFFILIEASNIINISAVLRGLLVTTSWFSYFLSSLVI